MYSIGAVSNNIKIRSHNIKIYNFLKFFISGLHTAELLDFQGYLYSIP